MALAGTQNQKRLFIHFGVCPKVLKRVLAAAGALFSLGRPMANNVDFWLHFGVIVGAEAQLSSLWGLPESILGGNMGCRFNGDFLWISRGRQDSEDVLGGWQSGWFGAPNPQSYRLPQETRYRTQDTGYRIQHRAYTYKHT